MEKETVRLHRNDGREVTITLAEYAGFCFGVGRAIDKTLEAAETYKDSGRKVSTCGSLIHNKIVTDELLEKGVGVIHAPEEAEEALNIQRQFPEGRNAAIIGEVSADHPGKVVVRTAFGGSRIASKLAGAQLPRIC